MEESCKLSNSQDDCDFFLNFSFDHYEDNHTPMDGQYFKHHIMIILKYKPDSTLDEIERLVAKNREEKKLLQTCDDKKHELKEEIIILKN